MNNLNVLFNAIKNLFSVHLKNYFGMVKQNVDDAISFTLDEPSSQKDYIKIGKVYVSKRSIFKWTLILATAACICIFFVLPFLEGRLWRATIIINSPKYHAFSGKARVLLEDRSLIYKGDMLNGKISGSGELYEQGEIIYKGDFDNDKYEGYGKLYAGGIKIYDGFFSNNQYEGYGEIFDDDGDIVYSGNFSKDLYEADGTLYYKNGNKKYIGKFSSGKYNGQGFEYYENGNLKYEGTFINNSRFGDGRLFYPDGTLHYTGGFVDNQFDGQGVIYNPDGSLKYSGGLLRGVYHGRGLLYAGNNKELYSGDFVQGIYEGYGRLMDSSGKPLYEGDFVNGIYDGYGRLMQDGVLLYKGQFKSGVYDGSGTLMNTQNRRTVYDGDFTSGLYNGWGTLYEASGAVLFDGMFFYGEIDYSLYLGNTTDEIRETFGTPQIILFEDSFLYLYHRMEVAFLFDAADDLVNPVLQRAIFLGDQKLLGGYKGMPITEIEKYNQPAYTAYELPIEALEEYILNILKHDYRQGDWLYSYKIIIDNAFIRFYFPIEGTKVLYYEVGLT